ncbi:MAG TPA: hypothetical protein PLM22_11640 [Candidatus Sabulitectum sp.]|nr:hypothetical protein [Candidatus Sabulitectum sp.]HPF31438.1 hypothetical protein [Candidatus Sabulitectum sp.]HPJ29574.1 hypothetical protein [Candidatus Sabulitectum sp.]HPR21166.1 hypothetical protein [Candidatus Sabulitectum sp.]HRW77328.1 hypothetical protein [Candidatus Sabulitectum sp.]
MSVEETRKIIEAETADLPPRWRRVLMEALLPGDYDNEAERLLDSAVSVHRCFPEDMETAEAILAGDAYIPMAITEMIRSGSTPGEILEAVRKFVNQIS